MWQYTRLRLGSPTKCTQGHGASIPKTDPLQGCGSSLPWVHRLRHLTLLLDVFTPRALNLLEQQDLGNPVTCGDPRPCCPPSLSLGLRNGDQTFHAGLPKTFPAVLPKTQKFSVVQRASPVTAAKSKQGCGSLSAWPGSRGLPPRDFSGAPQSGLHPGSASRGRSLSSRPRHLNQQLIRSIPGCSLRLTSVSCPCHLVGPQHYVRVYSEPGEGARQLSE